MPLLAKLAGDDVKIHAPADFDPVAFRQFVARNTLLGLDVESLPLDHVDKLNMYGPLRGVWLRLVQLGDEREAWNLNPRNAQQRAELVRVFSDVRKQFVTWSAIDAVAVAKCLGVDIVSQYFDGLTLALLLEPGELENHKLKQWATRYGMPELRQSEEAFEARADSLIVRTPVKPPRPKRRQHDTAATHRERIAHYEAVRLPEHEQALREYYATYPGGWSKWRDVELHDEHYQRYAGLDAMGVRRLWPLLVEACREKGIAPRTVSFELWLQQFATRMQLRGMLVDTRFAQAQLDDIGTRHAAARAAFVELTGVSPQSPKRADWLADRGIVFTAFNDSGSPSLKKIHVQDLLARYDRPSTNSEALQALRLLIEFAETKNLTDFATSLLQFCDANSYVHPNIRVLGAETGRWTVNKPAVQTLSNRNPIRGAFVPRAGFVLVSIDLSQIEVRIAAALAGETSLIEAFNKGVDGYNAVAERLFGAGFTKQQRSIAKRVVLATLYGSGIDTIVRQLHDIDGIVADADVVAEVRRNFRQSYPRIQAFARRVNTGEDVWLYSGRYVPGDVVKTYRGINSACQGSGRDILMYTVKRCDDAGFGDNILMTIHDEILFELPEAGLRQALLDLRKCFMVPFKAVSVDCDIEIYAERWGKDMLLPRREGLSRKLKGDDGETYYELARPWVARDDQGRYPEQNDTERIAA